MAEFNISPQNILTRISDYVPEILEFIEKIIQAGDGHESNSVVHFKNSECILWEKAEIDKPSWISRWGLGRPGPLINSNVISNILFSKNLFSLRTFFVENLFLFF
jgi:cysteinyl-tRNA synthetase